MALDIAQLQQLLDSAQKADAFKNDVKRALKKVGTSLSALQASIAEANELLSDDYKATPKERKPRAAKAPKKLGEIDHDAPFGRKNDGTPKSRPGRAKAAE